MPEAGIAITVSPFTSTYIGLRLSDELCHLATKLRSELVKNLEAVRPIPELDFTPPLQNCKALIGP